jgi:5-aminolevulinate synthase
VIGADEPIRCSEFCYGPVHKRGNLISTLSNPLSNAMDKLSSLARFKAACPFLARTKTSSLRTMCTSSSPRFSSITVLTEKAAKCPVMGPALAVRTKQIVAGYASVAASVDVHKIHQENGVFSTAGASVEKCPHASAARAAARMAEELAAAAEKDKQAKKAQAAAASSSSTVKSGCPFHQAAAAESSAQAAFKAEAAATLATTFDYDHFYLNQLQKKHDDKSYRYFNNINRLAAKFPVAHTGDPKEEVQVWCANDYLGMGNNPVVLETIRYVLPHGLVTESPIAHVISHSRTLEKYGAGAGGTRNIAGNGAMHLGLERELASLHRKPAALVFSSCYVANDATLSTLGAKLPGCVFFSDSMNHASMIQGIRHSRAQKVIFKHNDMEDLEAKLKMYPKETPKVIAFESVYSMCGSIAPIKEICDLAKQYGALTFLDEVCVAAKFVSARTHSSIRSMPSVCTDLVVPELQSTSTMMRTNVLVRTQHQSRALLWIASTLSPVR